MDNTSSHRPAAKRKRSRSPYRARQHDRSARRSRSPYRANHGHHHHRDRSPKIQPTLPFHSRHLHKRDLEAYRPLLAEYLDLQKHLDIGTLGEDEVKGRWKSFLRKWNAGELAEGWYDPEVKRKADARAAEYEHENGQAAVDKRAATAENAREDSDDSDDDGYGPALPDNARRSGPAIPGLQDLQHRQELDDEDRAVHRASLRHERKDDRKQQSQRLDELAPRAEPGTRERQLEKKREVAASNRTFAESKDGGAEEVAEGDLMGDDGVDGYKRKMKERERAKSEREVRKEEVLRARMAEREERLAKQRSKEEKTMEMLRGLARERFGAGGG